jgi:uncharacterized protein YeaO (DUF488 family)
MDILIKRIYDETSKIDGYRVLVDSIWPRGVRKENAKINQWMKEIATSTELRKWFNHNVERFDEFSKKRYLRSRESCNFKNGVNKKFHQKNPNTTLRCKR